MVIMLKWILIKKYFFLRNITGDKNNFYLLTFDPILHKVELKILF